ncbi:hypothetical protein QR680_009747 [Steinernema hermaphroditum]|uniref:Potassium channel domain-containing protein n=1 Tax=Steinernema hermaphroditum TaxID=289476 RepID=A0AA39MA10_9BILA|nr:hypothetical protein QR680_009747 [Steinernema hermaphroditum]
MLRSLSRRGSSLFGSQYYLRLQSDDPGDLRATERFLQSCSYSDFSSIAPCASWQNRVNSVRQAFLRFCCLPKSILLRLLIAFAVVWLISAAIIRPIERSHQLALQNEEDNRIYARRLQFLQRFGRMDYYIPMSNPEWEESTRYLIGWYQDQLINSTSTDWTFPYAFAFAYFTGSGSTIPGVVQVRLSTASKALLVLWFPLAICLYFGAVFALVNYVRRAAPFWRSAPSLPTEIFHHFLRSLLVAFLLLEFLHYRSRLHRKVLLQWSIEELQRRYTEHDRKLLVADYGSVSLWKRWETWLLLESDHRKIDFVLREIQNG